MSVFSIGRVACDVYDVVVLNTDLVDNAPHRAHVMMFRRQRGRKQQGTG